MNEETVVAVAQKIVAHMEAEGAISHEEASDFFEGFKENREIVKDIKKLKARIRNIKFTATTVFTSWMLYNWELVFAIIIGVMDAKG